MATTETVIVCKSPCTGVPSCALGSRNSLSVTVSGTSAQEQPDGSALDTPQAERNSAPEPPGGTAARASRLTAGETLAHSRSI